MTSLTRLWVHDDPDVTAVVQALPDLHTAAYVLGYLSPPWRARSAFSLAGAGETTLGLLARYTDGVTHSAIAFGTPAAIAAILQSPPVVAWRTALRVSGHPVWLSAADTTMEGFFPFMIAASTQPMECLVVDAAHFRCAAESGGDWRPPQRLTSADAAALNVLYSLAADDRFAHDELTTGIYCAIRDQPRDGTDCQTGHLVAAAGTPYLARAWRIATLGNVLTLPDWRGRGYAAACASMLTATLLNEGYDNVVLTVAQSNQPAARLYRRLGFQQRSTYTEARLVAL